MAVIVVGGVLAWQGNGQYRTNEFTGNGSGIVRLVKYAKDADGHLLGVNGEPISAHNPSLPLVVPDAEFELYRVVGGRPDEYVYTGRTNARGELIVPKSLKNGTYYFKEVGLPRGFDFDRDDRDGRTTDRYYFEIGDDDVLNPAVKQAFNRRGKLTVEKTIVSREPLTAEQLDMDFTFRVWFSDGNTYPVTFIPTRDDSSGAAGVAERAENALTTVTLLKGVSHGGISALAPLSSAEESPAEPTADESPSPEPTATETPTPEPTEDDPPVTEPPTPEPTADEPPEDPPSEEPSDDLPPDDELDDADTDGEPTDGEESDEEPDDEPLVAVMTYTPNIALPAGYDAGAYVEFTLKDAEQAVFNTVPIGVGYVVYEVEIPENYSPGIASVSGTIPRYGENPSGATAHFRNRYLPPTRSLYITKTVENTTDIDISGTVFTIVLEIDGMPMIVTLTDGAIRGPIRIRGGAFVDNIVEVDVPDDFEWIGTDVTELNGVIYVTVANRYTYTPTVTPSPDPSPSESPEPSDEPSPSESPSDQPSDDPNNPPTSATPDGVPTAIPPTSTPSGPHDGVPSKTGDNFNPTVWILIMCVCAIVALIVIIHRPRKK
ncbi:MAG: prealbumin-like fold domain-containing protein [Oscillospiraceae bacterium]|jgi:outer membrane biosynthesis protein TonB|nr:prealbumin-like fold domain-containing protein [Oscillospiraceae bacterium]